MHTDRTLLRDTPEDVSKGRVLLTPRESLGLGNAVGVSCRAGPTPAGWQTPVCAPLVCLGKGTTAGKRGDERSERALRRQWRQCCGRPPGAAAFGRMGRNQHEAERSRQGFFSF